MATTLPVLTFHALDDSARVASMRPEVFARGMQALHGHGYTTLAAAEVCAHVRARKPFPDRAVALCFDDGDLSVYRHAFPVLQTLGLRATVFALVGERDLTRQAETRAHFEGRPLLTGRELQEMHRGGMHVGAHSRTHADLTRVDDAQLQREVVEGQQALEDLLGAPVPCFAYPYGRLDARSHRLVSRHFEGAFSDRLALVALDDDRHALPRVDTYYLRTDRRFRVLFGPLFKPYVRLRALPRALRRLAGGWR